MTAKIHCATCAGHRQHNSRQSQQLLNAVNKNLNTLATIGTLSKGYPEIALMAQPLLVTTQTALDWCQEQCQRLCGLAHALTEKNMTVRHWFVTLPSQPFPAVPLAAAAEMESYA